MINLEQMTEDFDCGFCNTKAPEKPTMVKCGGSASRFNKELHQWSAERITTLEHELMQSNKEVKRLRAKK